MSPESKKQIQVDDKFETLRYLLEQQQKKTFTLDEANEIGETLINFFELLADNSQNNFDLLTTGVS